MSVVIDANIAVKWVVEEDHSQLASALLRHKPDSPIIAPDIILIESANALRKKHVFNDYPAEDVPICMDVIEAGIFILISSYQLYKNALSLSLEINHPIYDCLYLAASIHTRTQLVTPDQKFCSKLQNSRYSSNVVWVEELQNKD